MSATGWPFLVGRGRRHGYTVLLAPTWLVSRGDHGFLEDKVSPLPDRTPWRVAAVTTAGGSPVGLAWAEHTVTADELAGPARDEHSRPLRLLYGFLHPGAPIGHPTQRDLARSLDAALDAYRRFLADEDGYTVEGSDPFDLTSAVADDPAPPPPQAPTPRPRPTPLPRTLLPAGIVVILVSAGAIWLATSGSGEAPPPTCPVSSTTEPTPPSTSAPFRAGPATRTRTEIGTDQTPAATRRPGVSATCRSTPSGK